MPSYKHDISSGWRLCNPDGNVFVNVRNYANQERRTRKKFLVRYMEHFGEKALDVFSIQKSPDPCRDLRALAEI